MAKKEKGRKKAERTKAEKLARRAGKIAARAEIAAREAVDKARETSTMIVDFIAHPKAAIGALTGHSEGENAGHSEWAAGDRGGLVDDLTRQVEQLQARIAELEGGGAAKRPRAAATKKAGARKTAARAAEAAPAEGAPKPRARRAAAGEARRPRARAPARLPPPSSGK